MKTNVQKEYTLQAEHRARLMTMTGLFLTNLLEMLVLFGLLTEEMLLVKFLDYGLTVFLAAAVFMWVNPMFHRKVQATDEMAYENLNKAMNATLKTLLVVFSVLIAAACLAEFSMEITMDSTFLGTFMFMLFSLFFGLQSLFFLMIERKGSASDHEEEND